MWQLGSQAVLNLPWAFPSFPSRGPGADDCDGQSRGNKFFGMAVSGSTLGLCQRPISTRPDSLQDNEARDWNADELLKNLKEGTEAR